MNKLLLVSAIFLLPLLAHGQSEIGGSDLGSGINSNGCLSDNEWTKENVKIFLTDQAWAPERQETGAQGISATQIQVLSNNNSQDEPACDFFSSEFGDAISKEWPDGDPMYQIAYYKAGNYYFVSIIPAQPDDSDEVAVGLSFLAIYDSNLNRKGGYSF